MPRTKLDEKFRTLNVPPPNYLSEMLKRYKKAQKLSDDEIAERTGACRKTVNTRLNQKPEAWNIGELMRYCDILGAPIDEALAMAAKK